MPYAATMPVQTPTTGPSNAVKFREEGSRHLRPLAADRPHPADLLTPLENQAHLITPGEAMPMMRLRSRNMVMSCVNAWPMVRTRWRSSVEPPATDPNEQVLDRDDDGNDADHDILAPVVGEHEAEKKV
jgi:hypothetical protein